MYFILPTTSHSILEEEMDKGRECRERTHIGVRRRILERERISKTKK